MTPFEVFRSPINVYRQTGGKYIKGYWVQGSYMQFSNDFVTGNQIAMTINGNALSTVNYTTSNDNTLLLLKAQIETVSSVLQAIIDDDTIYIVSKKDQITTINSVIIIGGASQPSVILHDQFEVISTTASIQPTNGEDMKLVPEGRRDQKTYKLYTSTQMKTVTDQNPDQVEIRGERYEVMEVWPWQNTLVLSPTHHYKYIAMKINTLTP